MPEHILPIDDSVAIPPSVKRAAEAAVAAHKAAYGEPEAPHSQVQPDPAREQPGPQPQPEPQSDPAREQTALQTAPQTALQTDPVPQASLSNPEDRSGVDPASWEGRYYAMEGRFRQSQITMGQMQQQMAELGDELQRVTSVLQTRGTAQEQPRQAVQSQARLLTDADVATYGPELIDVVKRAALEAVQPELQQVTQQTRQVNQRVAQTATAGLYQQLDAHCPTWREINVNPRFKAWCRSPDVYSGQVRGRLLNAAFQAADAPRVIAFFKGFQDEEVATGNAPAPQPEPQSASLAPVPRQAAVSLDTLTAPGRAKPATGDTLATSAEKPFVTLAQIRWFYSQAGRASYVGRDAERKADEATIFAAQREGRVKG